MATSKKNKARNARARSQARQQADKRRDANDDDHPDPEVPATTRASIGRVASGLKDRANSMMIGGAAATPKDDSSDGDRPSARRPTASANRRVTPRAPAQRSATDSGAREAPEGSVSVLDKVRGRHLARTDFTLSPPAPGPIKWLVVVSVTAALIAFTIVILLLR